jgi:hypothetical protein
MDDLSIHIDELVLDDTLADQIRDKVGGTLAPEHVAHVRRAIAESVGAAASRPSEGHFG